MDFHLPFVPPAVWISIQRINAALACVQHARNRHNEDIVPIRTNDGCILHINRRSIHVHVQLTRAYNRIRREALTHTHAHIHARTHKLNGILYAELGAILHTLNRYRTQYISL